MITPATPLTSTPFGAPHCRRAFTLVELLVVIAIIAILASLAIPAVGSATKKARASQALSNMKQIGTAFSLYAGENNMVLPLAKTFWPQQPYGLEGLEPYLNTVNGKGAGKFLYVCPNRTIKANRAQMDASGWLNYRTFSCNPNALILNDVNLDGTVNADDRKLVTSIARPSQVIAIIDATQKSDGLISNTAPNGHGSVIDPSVAAMKTESMGDTLIPTDGDSDPQASRGYIRYRHPGEVAMAVFCDWHAEPIKKGTLKAKNFATSY